MDPRRALEELIALRVRVRAGLAACGLGGRPGASVDTERQEQLLDASLVHAAAAEAAAASGGGSVLADLSAASSSTGGAGLYVRLTDATVAQLLDEVASLRATRTAEAQVAGEG